MSTITLYHGSTVAIEHIDLVHSKPGKDFGRGFYLSAEREQALALASFKADQEGVEPVVTAYEWNEAHLTNGTLRVLRFDDYNPEWAQFVCDNRCNTTAYPAHPYDVVIGPIANDRVGIQIRRYIEHDIDIDTFLRHLRYMKGITFQYYFGTPRAIQTLLKL